MKFKILKSDLEKQISIAQKAISNKSSMQILNGIVFEAYNDELVLSSTDLELSINTKVECKVEENGIIVLNSTNIGNIIRKMPEDIITITIKGDDVNISCQNSIFDIKGQDAKDYPPLPMVDETPTFTIDNKDLVEAIRETIFATSDDETRLALTGVLLEMKEDMINFVGLDGYRLAVRKFDYNFANEISSIIPKRALNELSKILNDKTTDVAIIKGHIVFINGNTKMYSRLIDKNYIDYSKIASTNYTTKILVNKDDLYSSLDRALLLTSAGSASLTKLTVEGDMISIKSNSELGKLNEKVFCNKEGNDLEIAFNTKYLIDGIRAINDDKINIYMTGPLAPAVMRPASHEKDYLYLVLPVRTGK